MTRNICKIAGILIVAAALAIPASAQLREAPGEERVTEHEVTGTVIREKSVEVKESGIDHQVVMLQTEDGDRIVADLGPEANLEDMNFEHGREISLRGTVARVSDRPVLLAREVSAEGRAISIERPELAPPAAERTAMDFSRPVEVSGEIAAEKSVVVENLPDKNKVVLLELERGDSLVADLGPEDRIETELATGDQVRVNGRLAQIGDRLVLLADKVSTGDKSVEIDRLIPQE